MTSVGLLCRQYLGAKRDNPMLTGGMAYLMTHLPDEGIPNIYYWYYATQVMHNMSGYEWDTWNRKMRELLVHTQVRNVDECANGSWAPEKDAWGKRGGRVMQTSLSALTLEIYYRYLPLFKAERRCRRWRWRGGHGPCGRKAASGRCPPQGRRREGRQGRREDRRKKLRKEGQELIRVKRRQPSWQGRPSNAGQRVAEYRLMRAPD